MHPRALPKGSRDLLARIEKRTPVPLRGWTLAGGTGLALQLGHRISEDFDFFKTSRFSAEKLAAALAAIGPCETLQREASTLTVLVQGIKISFFQVLDPFLFPASPFSFFKIADVRDIALMKIAAALNRGSRKDFVDLYCIFRREWTLKDCLSRLPKKFGEGRINEYQLLQSLTWFDDAEQEPLPRMLEPLDWEDCKAFFLRETHSLILPP